MEKQYMRGNRPYNRVKMVFGKALGEKLKTYGITPIVEFEDKYNSEEIVYLFSNDYTVRSIIRKLSSKNN